MEKYGSVLGASMLMEEMLVASVMNSVGDFI